MMATTLNQRLGEFEILAKLGEGGGWTIYKARQSSSKRIVALKVLSPYLAKDAEYLVRFKRDAAAAANMSHPNLVQVHCVGEHEGVHYVATEFVEDDTLRQRLDRRGKLEPREALAVAFYTARALLYAWNKALLAHFDIGPDSIFVRQAGDVKVDDLGLSKPAVNAASATPPAAGRLLYTSPERARAVHGMDFRADIYGLGCALYHMLTGKPPYESGDAKVLLSKHTSEPPPDITKLWPACPASLGRLLAKMMAKRPEERHRSYDDLITELLAVRDEIKRATQLQTTGISKIEGRSFAGFTLLAKLSQDNISVTYKARQSSPKRDAVVRLLAPRAGGGAEFVARVKREVANAASLDHPNILQVYAGGEADGVCYIAHEFVEGRTLHKRMERRGQLHPREALAIVFYAARALQHAWDKAKLTHTAITLDNVILTDSGELKLGDFGIARIVVVENAATARKGLPVGSPHYTSPEQARGEKDLDCRADIYSLGCLLYHTLTGKPPYSADNPTAIMTKQANDPPPMIRKAWPGCPALLAKLMDRMLAKSRQDRPQNYDELLAELVKVREEFRRVKAVSAPTPAESAPNRPAQPKPESAVGKTTTLLMAGNRKPLYVGAGIAAVAVLGGLLLWAPWKRPPIHAPSLEEQRPDYASSRVTPFAPSSSPQSEVTRPTIRPDTTTYTPPPPRPAPRAPKPRATPSLPPEPPPAPATTTVEKPPETPSPSESPMAPRATLARVGSKEIVLDMPSSATPTEQPMTDEAFATAIATLPPQEQIRRVVARLQELNPGFNGKANYKIENNVVAELTISTTGSLVPTVGVSDMTPLKTLKHLQRLVLAPAKPNEPGALPDLSSLSGMKLTWLACQGNSQLHDLSPLKDMPLTGLSCGGTQVKDLTPLSAMRLATLGINDTPVEDITSLAGMPLTVLWCNNTKIADLSPLKGAPLRELRCDFMMVRDAELLRGIRTLAKINDLPVATFWKRAELTTAAPNVVARAVKTAPDFTSLFNGQDMTGWKVRASQRENGWRVRRHSMINTPPSNDLVTKEQFSNFEFYCEFQIPRRGYSGVLLRGRYRIPLLDDMRKPPSAICSGSVYELLAPTKNAIKPADTWQALYVRLVGNTITVILNNKKVIDSRELNESGGSFAEDVTKTGPIVLVGTGTGVTFRNLRIKPLVEKEN